MLSSTVCNGTDATLKENNEVGIVVTTIQRLNTGVALSFLKPPENNPFIIEGDQIIVTKTLDYEVKM